MVLNHEGPPSVKPKFSPRNKSLGCRGKRNRLREPRVWLALWRTARRGPGPVPTTSPLPTTHQAPPKSRKRRTRSRRPSSHPTNRCRANTRSRLAHHRGESRCVNRWRCSRARCPRRTARPPLPGQSGSWEGTCDGWGVRSVMMRWVRSARRRGETNFRGWVPSGLVAFLTNRCPDVPQPPPRWFSMSWFGPATASSSRHRQKREDPPFPSRAPPSKRARRVVTRGHCWRLQISVVNENVCWSSRRVFARSSDACLTEAHQVTPRVAWPSPWRRAACFSRRAFWRRRTVA